MLFSCVDAWNFPRGQTGAFFNNDLLKKLIENIPKLKSLKEEIIELDCGEQLGYGTSVDCTKEFDRERERTDKNKREALRKLKWEQLKKMGGS